VVEIKTYTVRAERSGHWWALDAPEIPGLYSQARRLDQAEEMARDAVSAMLDLPSDSFEIEVVPVLSPGTEEVLRDRATARSEAADAERRREAVDREAALALTKGEGLTVRDAGKVMGLSYQRVSQLATHTPSVAQKLLEANDELDKDHDDFGQVESPVDV
jgi:hypothetical protein